MKRCTTLDKLSQCIDSVVPNHDNRAIIQPNQLVLGMIFSMTGITKGFSLENMRRFIKNQFNVSIERSSFWERIGTKKLTNILESLLFELMGRLIKKSVDKNILMKELNVLDILLIDSSSVSLWDGLAKIFKGNRTNSGIKWHACFNVFSGSLEWMDISATSTNDAKCFPILNKLVNKLIIFDLGYWGYGLLFSIDEIKGFFLSRVKSNSNIFIQNIITGKGMKQFIGKYLSDVKLNKKRGEIVEFFGDIIHEKEIRTFRVLGFWNKKMKIYHWYITNLTVDAKLIYPLYRLRWRIELIFKSIKSSFGFDQLPSGNERIIKNIFLARIVAFLCSNAIIESSKTYLDEEKKNAVSVLRIAKIMTFIGEYILKYIINKTEECLSVLKSKIKLFSNEIYDPNFKRRRTSIAILMDMCTLEKQNP